MKIKKLGGRVKKKATQMTKKARRTYSIRSDSRVGSAQRQIEKVFGLPRGSVRLHLPRGRKARADKFIDKLLRDWKS